MHSYLLLYAILSTNTQATPLAMPNPSYSCDPITGLCSPFSNNAESIDTKALASNVETPIAKLNPINDDLDVQTETDGSYTVASQDVQSETPKPTTSNGEASESNDPAPLSLYPTCNQYHDCKTCDYSDLRRVYCDPADMFFDEKCTLEKPLYKVCSRTSQGPGLCYRWDGELMNE